MRSLAYHTSLPGLLRLRRALFPWTLAFATGLDYYDNTLFSFFTSYIAGGINSSPDELVWATSAYAVAAVLGILQQQWWVERIGFRRYIVGCLLFYAVASLGAAMCESSLELAVVRGFQGYFLGPMMGTCRILLQIRFTAQQRAPATRAFLLLLLLGTAMAPLAGGILVSYFGWSALFACSAPAAVLYAVAAMFTVPDIGYTEVNDRTSANFWPYILFAFAQAALQIVTQQVRFELFSANPELLVLMLAGIGSLVWFAWQQWHHPNPLVRLTALRLKSYRTGLVLFIFYYYETTTFSYLISRFLEGGLNYPVENAGRLVGLTSMISPIAMVIYMRYAKLIKQKKLIIVPGFVMAAFAAFWMTRMSPDASQAWLLPALMVRGLLMMFIIMPVAGLTFRVFELEEYTHSYRLKNIVRQLTFSFATATVIIVEQHRLALHRTRLVETINPYNPQFQQMLSALTRGFEAAGQLPQAAHGLALVRISQWVEQQASFMSSLDGFRFLIIVAVCGGIFAAWQKQIN